VSRGRRRPTTRYIGNDTSLQTAAEGLEALLGCRQAGLLLASFHLIDRRYQ
jgi:hypothetical protein